MSDYPTYTPRAKKASSSTTTSSSSSSAVPTVLAKPAPAHFAPPQPSTSTILPPPTSRRQSSISAQNPAAGMPSPTSYTGSFLRARALAKVQKLTNDVAPHLESVKQSAASKLTQLRDNQQDRSAWGDDPRFLRARQNRDYQDPTRKDSSSSAASVGSSETSSNGARTGWIAGVSNYFNGGNQTGSDGSQARRQSTTAYTEERIVCFPGWATLRPSAHSASEPALVLEVVAHGYAYRLRPLSQASRSQRVFGSLARSFAALPRIPPHLLPNDQQLDSLPQPEIVKDEALEDGNIFERLLDIGGREGTTEEEQELARATVLASEPEEMTQEEQARSPTGRAETHGLAKEMSTLRLEPDGKTNLPEPSPPIVAGPTKVQRQNRVNAPPVKPELPPKPAALAARQHADRASTLPPTSSTRQASVSSQATTSTTSSSKPASTRPSSPYRDRVYHDEWPEPFEFTENDLPRLHSNLQDRLLPFFGQKLPARKVRLSIVPVLDAGTLWDKPLATKVVSTLGGGAFKTVLEVRSKELRRLLQETGKGVESLERLKIQVVASLLESDPLNDTFGGFTGHQGTKVVAEDQVELCVAHDGGVRIISDLDDTCKHSQVLAGTKTLFRNVFVRELYEVQVPGMAKWFEKMKAERCAFHYVSNSPWELWPVIRDFLALGRFPGGSVTLKEYGGASSALAKLWEEPGLRKRANVETIIKEFKHSQFILIGDSGEQDLELYAQLACDYPDHILAIYIRDVTTTFAPNAHPDLSHTSSTHQKTFSEMPDLPGQFDGSHETPLNANRPSMGRQRSSFMARTLSGRSSRAPSPPLIEPDSDPLSPNNPLRPSNVTPSQAEEQAFKMEMFYNRIREAEKKIPKGILLKIFRHGKEVESEALEVIKFGGTGGVPSDKKG